MARQCCECRAGEHDNYTDCISLVVVKDPETAKIIRRGYMCSEHLEVYLDDGYTCYSDGHKIDPGEIENNPKLHAGEA